jgi:transcriptional regulator with XRE-family HTH domain
MAWKEINTDELAAKFGINAAEAREKQKLMLLIAKTRKEQKLSQTLLAKKVGVSQSRIAQIETGVGTSKTSFDVLFKVLSILGFEFKILPKRAA